MVQHTYANPVAATDDTSILKWSATRNSHVAFDGINYVRIASPEQHPRNEKDRFQQTGSDKGRYICTIRYCPKLCHHFCQNSKSFLNILENSIKIKCITETPFQFGAFLRLWMQNPLNWEGTGGVYKIPPKLYALPRPHLSLITILDLNIDVVSLRWSRWCVWKIISLQQLVSKSMQGIISL